MSLKIDVPKSLEEKISQVGTILRESWLCGLGLVATGSEVVGRTFDELVARGQRKRGSVVSAEEGRRDAVASFRDTLSEKVEAFWNRTLAQLNVPTRRDVEELSRRIEALSARLS
jgi:polyhydroxyalkanoate synthesis regulator phasin